MTGCHEDAVCDLLKIVANLLVHVVLSSCQLTLFDIPEQVTEVFDQTENGLQDVLDSPDWMSAKFLWMTGKPFFEETQTYSLWKTVTSCLANAKIDDLVKIV